MLGSVKELQFLTELETLSIKNNYISDMNELTDMLVCLQKLKSLAIVGNEVTKVKKYRDMIILSSASVETIDGKDVTKQERQFILKLSVLKKAAVPKKVAHSSSTGHIQPLPEPKHAVHPPKLPPKLTMAKY